MKTTVFTEDVIAEFLTKAEWKKCKNMQNILLNGCYLLYEKLYLQVKKTSVYILKPEPRNRLKF